MEFPLPIPLSPRLTLHQDSASEICCKLPSLTTLPESKLREGGKRRKKKIKMPCIPFYHISELNQTSKRSNKCQEQLSVTFSIIFPCGFSWTEERLLRDLGRKTPTWRGVKSYRKKPQNSGCQCSWGCGCGGRWQLNSVTDFSQWALQIGLSPPDWCLPH